MINSIFEEVKNEARNGEIFIIDDGYKVPIRMSFNIAIDNIRNDIPNFYIKDINSFNEKLKLYVINALKFYELEETYENIKQILTFVWSNITNFEMNNIEQYLDKYISFINDESFFIKNGYKYTSIGNLNFEVTKQSIKQETPYCFKSYFENINGSKYALPRISFGIKDNICYIYSIQNKDSKINVDSKYNLIVKDSIRTINSGVKKYRNITPSFVVALSLFLSFLKLNNISMIKVETPLPIRINNRESVSNYKIKFQTLKGTLKGETLENFKKEILAKRLEDDYNSTVKFVNCFNRLKVHFDNVYLSKNELNNDMILEIINLITTNHFLQEIVNEDNFCLERKINNGKIS